MEEPGDATPEAMPEAMPKTMPKAMPEAMPKATPEAMPKAMAELLQKELDLMTSLREKKSLKSTRLQEARKKIEEEMEPQIKALKDELSLVLQQQIQALEWDGWQDTKVTDLSDLSVNQIDCLVGKVTGCAMQFAKWRPGDTHWHTRTPEDRKSVGKRFLKDHHCKYCKSVLHPVKKCPILAKKTCSICHKKGHTRSACLKLARDVY